MKNIPIGQVLVEKNYITEAQLEEAITYQKEHPGEKRIGNILIEKGFVTEKQILNALCDKLNLHILPLESFPVDIEAVKKIPREIATKYTALAVAITDKSLTVVLNDPLNFYCIEDIRQVTGMSIEIALAERAKIENAIHVFYSEIETKQVAEEMRIAESEALEALSNAEVRDLNDTDRGPIIQMLNSLLLHGYNIGASDIHIEPLENELRIRLRVDGMLINYITLARTMHPPLIARTKILSNLDIAEKRLPQDGHFKARIEGITMNLRVSFIPTVYGEKVVLRFLDSNITITHAGQFGMNETNYKRFYRMLQNPNGIVYITGPTGSGKTTTLYMALEEIVKRPVNISTIEDPVERHIVGVNQMQVNNIAGLSFMSGLRALLRQDPDIIMVGETRDKETASISIRSAITGHLVLSTLHTNDALSSIVRLEDMGIEPYLVANSLCGLVAQRLIRLICPYCKESYIPTDQEIKLLNDKPPLLYHGKGCPACNQTGYKGRIAIHEVVEIDHEIRKMITNKNQIDDIYRYAKETQDFTRLRDEAINLVLEGSTTTEELMKLTYSID
jgi:type IV pilus assembly protein PilB